jgi:hypothetical protein
MAELRRENTGRRVSTADRITFHRENSRVIPNLVYYWAVRAPAGTTHVSRVAVAGVDDNGVMPIRSPADWHVLAMRSWKPTADSTLVEACAEAVRLTDTGRFPGSAYHLVREPRDVLGLPLPDPAGLVAQVQAPSISRTDTQATAEFWLVQTRDVIRYGCRLSASGIRLEALRRIREAGVLPPN